MVKTKSNKEKQKLQEGKNPTGKGKYIIKAVDQPLNKLLRRLKDKNCKINYNYNKQGIDMKM